MDPRDEESSVGTRWVQEGTELGRGECVKEVDGPGGDGEKGCVADAEVRENGVRSGEDVGEARGGGAAWGETEAGAAGVSPVVGVEPGGGDGRRTWKRGMCAMMLA